MQKYTSGNKRSTRKKLLEIRSQIVSYAAEFFAKIAGKLAWSLQHCQAEMSWAEPEAKELESVRMGVNNQFWNCVGL